MSKLPSGWRVGKLGEVIELIGGGTPKTSISEYWNGNIPWLSVVDFAGDNRWVSSTEKKITKLGLKNSSTKLLKENDLIISARGTVGELAQLKKEMAFNQSCYGIKNIDKVTDVNFLYYLIKFSIVKLKRKVHGAVFDTITRQTFDTIEITLPPLPEQKAIAEILSSLDEKIELLQEENKILEELAQTIFKEWFVNFNFPGATVMVESEPGEIPKGWRVGKLGEIMFLNGEKVKKEELPDKIPYVPIDVIPRKKMTLSEYKSDEEANSSLILFKENHILFGAMRSYFHKVVIAPFNGVTRTTCFVLETIKKEDLSFAFLRVFQDDVIAFSERTSKGSTMPYAVWEDTLENMPIIIPSEGVRIEFNDKIYSFLDKMKQSIFEIKNLEKIRDNLLPKSMSGEIKI